jgi:hypothetical protein
VVVAAPDDRIGDPLRLLMRDGRLPHRRALVEVVCERRQHLLAQVVRVSGELIVLFHQRTMLVDDAGLGPENRRRHTVVLGEHPIRAACACGKVPPIPARWLRDRADDTRGRVVWTQSAARHARVTAA